MAIAKRNELAGKLLGAGLALSAAFVPATANAQEVTQAATSETVDTILCQTDEVYNKAYWTSETADLDCADDAATEYAENNYGIGILIHVGGDIPNKNFANADQFGEALANLFKQKYGVDAQYFLSQNDAPATVITYHFDNLIHGADNGTEVKNVKDALAAMTEVVEYLKIAKQDEVAQISQLPILVSEPGGS